MNIPGYITRDFHTESRRFTAPRSSSPPVIRRSAPKRETNTWYIQKTGRQMIEGACVTEHVNSHGQILDPAGMQCDGLPLPLLWEHDKQIGEVVWMRRAPGAVFCRALVWEDKTFPWACIQAGEVRSLSVGPQALQPAEEIDGALVFHAWKLTEVSVCREGANPEAQFYIWTPPSNRPIRLMGGV